MEVEQKEKVSLRCSAEEYRSDVFVIKDSRETMGDVTHSWENVIGFSKLQMVTLFSTSPPLHRDCLISSSSCEASAASFRT